MKLYISVDMEGLAGITNWKDETEDQVRFRKAMNEQVEWVLEGIAKAMGKPHALSPSELISFMMGKNLIGGRRPVNKGRLADISIPMTEVAE